MENIFNNLDNINSKYNIYINTLDDIPINQEFIKYNSKDIINFNNNYDHVYEYVNKYKDSNIVIFMLTNQILINKLVSMFANDISFNSLDIGKVNIVSKNMKYSWNIGSKYWKLGNRVLKFPI